MQIEILGYFIIPLGIVLFFLNEKWLLYATILFMGFTGASIINIGSELSIQPSYFLGMMFILKHLLNVLKNKKIVKPSNILVIFLIICLCSIVMPILVKNDGVIVIDQDNKYSQVEFSSKNITQLIYLFYCFVFYWITKDYFNEYPEKKKDTIKILIYGSILVAILGLYQELAYVLGLEFDKIFRSGVHGNVQPYGSFTRIYSTTIESSMLAYYIAPIIVLLLCLNDNNIIKHKYLVLFLLIIVGICTISTTFFLGIISFIIIVLMEKRFKNIHNKRVTKRIFITSIIAIVALTIVYSVNKDIINSLLTTTQGKIDKTSVSGTERTTSFLQHVKIGFEYPFLGVGFGTARSKDLFSTWICNVGVLGLSIFIFYLFFTINRLKNSKDELSYSVSQYILILFICAFTSVSEPYNLFIWYAFALAENIIAEKNEKEKCNSNNN